MQPAGRGARPRSVNATLHPSTRAAFLLAGAVLLAGCTSGSDRLGAPAPATSPPPSAGVTEPGSSAPSGPNMAQLFEPCPIEAKDVLAGQEPTVRVPPGATQARVCLHSNGITSEQNPKGEPTYYLAGGQEAAALADRYASLKPSPSDQACTMELGPTASVLFGYADESVVAITTDLYGCGTSRVVPAPGAELTVTDGAGLRAELRRLGSTSSPTPAATQPTS